jgi:hypothetical protein
VQIARVLKLPYQITGVGEGDEKDLIASNKRPFILAFAASRFELEGLTGFGDITARAYLINFNP